MKNAFKLLPVLLVIGTTALAAPVEKTLNVHVFNKAPQLGVQGYKLALEIKGTPNDDKTIFFKQIIDLPSTPDKQTVSFDITYPMETINPQHLKVKLLEPGADELSSGVYVAYYKHPIVVSKLYSLNIEVNSLNSIRLTPTQDDYGKVPIDGNKNYSAGHVPNIGRVVEVVEVA